MMLDELKQIYDQAGILTRDEWKQICEQTGKWCEYGEVKNLTYDQAVQYVQTMPTFIPM